MAKITVMDLLNSVPKTDELVDGLYPAKIVGLSLSNSKFGGSYYTVDFDLTEKNFSPNRIAKFVTCKLPSGDYSTKFVNLLKTFFNFESLKEIDPQDLVGKKCSVRISVAGWPKIDEVIPA